jgi:hypothetical protein
MGRAGLPDSLRRPSFWAPGAPRTIQADRIPVVCAINSARVPVGATSEASVRYPRQRPESPASSSTSVMIRRTSPTSVASRGAPATSMFSVRQPSASSAEPSLLARQQHAAWHADISGHRRRWTNLSLFRPGLLEDEDGLAQGDLGRGHEGRRNDIVGTVNALDRNCSGVVSVADALVVLKYAGEGNAPASLAARLREARSTALCGSKSTQTASLTPATRSISCSTRPGSHENLRADRGTMLTRTPVSCASLQAEWPAQTTLSALPLPRAKSRP